MLFKEYVSPPEFVIVSDKYYIYFIVYRHHVKFNSVLAEDTYIYSGGRNDPFNLHYVERVSQEISYYKQYAVL